MNPKPKRLGTYKYTALDEDSNEVRLMMLKPGKWYEPVRVTLRTISLQELSTNPFEALSYTWGPTTWPDLIIVGSGSVSGTLSVTRNLAEALLYLRYEDRERVLWIDAICIDQCNLVERSRQVTKMADLYISSTRVVVWLGPERDNSNLALDYLANLNQCVRSTWVDFSMEATTEESHWANPNETLLMTANEASALDRLLSRDWFGRLWIWQEIWNASSSSMLICGHCSMLWSDFRNSMLPVLYKSWPTHAPQPTRGRSVTIVDMCRKRATHFEEFTEQTMNARCSDARDRIYALQSLLAPTDFAKQVEPDYRKSVAEVYLEVFLAAAIGRGEVSLLERCSIEDALPGCPTWLPNFSVPLSSPVISASTSSFCKNDVALIGNNVLRVQGVLIEEISIAVEPKIDSATYQNDFVIARLQELMLVFGIEERELPEFVDAVICGSFSDVWYPKNVHHPDRNEAFNLAGRLYANLPISQIVAGLSSNQRMYIDYFAMFSAGRSLFRTKSGRLGLGPTCAQSGDALAAIVLGSRAVTVLRPQPSGTFQVVGVAYLPSEACNEVLLGPLPPDYRVCYTIRSDGIEYRGFYDEKDNHVIYGDPRLDPLAGPWEYITGKGFQNCETGEVTDWDPRRTVDALKARGVKFVDIDLV